VGYYLPGMIQGFGISSQTEASPATRFEPPLSDTLDLHPDRPGLLAASKIFYLRESDHG